jgi:hypothetical protein
LGEDGAGYPALADRAYGIGNAIAKSLQGAWLSYLRLL